MFMTWLHTEAGYRFTGEDGIYALTFPEMKVLYDGYSVMREQADMQEKGVSQYEQAKFKDFARDVNSGGDAGGAQAR